MDNGETNQEHRKHKVVHGDFVVEADEAEELTTGNALETVFTSGERHLKRQKVDDLRQRQSHHGKVDALSADGEEAEYRAENQRKPGAGKNAEYRPESPLFGHITGNVRGTAEERGVPERQQAGVAEQQVEGAGEEREAQQVHHKDRVGIEGRAKAGDQHDDKQNAVDHGLTSPYRISPQGGTTAPAPSGRRSRCWPLAGKTLW